MPSQTFQKLFSSMKERRIWRVLVGYPSVSFVLLQAIEFFINNYNLDSRLLTVGVITAIVLLPAAFLWNWRHGEVGTQNFSRGEIAAYILSIILLGIALTWYWNKTPAQYREVVTSEQVRTVAVMPFMNIAGEENVQYLCDGISESLINWLAKAPEIRVSSKTASFRLRDLGDDTSAIASELGVDSVMTGRLERIDDQVIVSASIIDVRNDTQLWGERLVYKSSDLLSLEQSIVSALTSELSLSLGAEDVEAAGETSNPVAYQHYLRGHHLIQATDPILLQQGLDELRSAIRADPGYARPYTDIADSLSQMLFFGMVEGEALLGEARNAAYTAVALAPGLAEAQTALAAMQQYFEHDWAAADSAYEKAVSLNPQSPVPFHRYTDYLAFTLRFDRAREMARRAMAIDPLDGNSMHAVGIVELLAGNYEEAAMAFGDWNRFYPQSTWSNIKHGLALAMNGQCGEALGQVTAAEELSGGRLSALGQSWLIWSRKVCDDASWESRALNLLEDQQNSAHNRLTAGNIVPLILLGRTDELIDRVETNIEARDPLNMFLPAYGQNLPGFGTHLALDSRFRELMETLNFPPTDADLKN